MFFIFVFILIIYLRREPKIKPLTKADRKDIKSLLKGCDEAFKQRVHDMQVEDLINPPMDILDRKN